MTAGLRGLRIRGCWVPSPSARWRRSPRRNRFPRPASRVLADDSEGVFREQP